MSKLFSKSTGLMLATAFLSTFLLIISGCSRAAQQPVSRSRLLLGTYCTITIFENTPERVFESAFERVEEIESKMSTSLETSEISEINRLSGTGGRTVSEDTYFVVARGLEYSNISNGAFDISVGPLVKIWGIGTEEAAVPDKETLAVVLELIGYSNIQLDPETRKVFLNKEGMKLDLGGIAKGYAADEAARVLTEAGVKSAIIDFGGNILTLGTKRNREPWRIGIQAPQDIRGDYIGILSSGAAAVVTSGNYERYFEKDGKRYHHILDTETGYPVDNGLISVTIRSADALSADALSTAVFSLGPEKGLALIESLSETEAILVTDTQEVIVSSGIGKDFELTEPSFTFSTL
jgi:FAD:protein FMN transferase